MWYNRSGPGKVYVIFLLSNLSYERKRDREKEKE